MFTLKQSKLIVALLIVLTTMSFKNKTPREVLTGTYGVCSCGTESSSKVELTINQDFTFHYYDNSDADKIIDLKGKWIQTESAILLKDYPSDISIHNKWTIDKTEKCLKSRKGLEWTRLCHLKSCN